jgi:hypothetical protein
MTSPEERRWAQIHAMDTGTAMGGIGNELKHSALLAYFDEHEPAVADAIRYGLLRSSWTVETGGDEEGMVHFLRIDYPEGHPKR